MSFTPNIPASAQSLGNSRTQVLNNMAILRSSLAVDHVDVNDTGNGKHKYCHLVIQGSAPTTNGTEGALYAKTVGSNAVLFFRAINSGLEMQLTGNTVAAVSNDGAVFLGQGITLMWGQATKGTGGTVTFPYGGFNTIFQVQLTILENNNNRHFVHVKTVSNTNFTVASRDSSGNDENNTFYWMAWGLKTS